MPSGPTPGRILGRSENNSYTYISWEEVTITNFKNPLNSNEYIDFTLYGREGCLLMLNQLLVVLVECSVQAYDHVARFSCSCFKHLLASQVLYTKNLFFIKYISPYIFTFQLEHFRQVPSHICQIFLSFLFYDTSFESRPICSEIPTHRSVCGVF